MIGPFVLLEAKKMIKYLFILILLSVTTVSWAQTDGTMQINRYSTLKQEASAAQVNPLLAIVQVKFPTTVQSVGDAVNYLLRYTGYTLVDVQERSQPLQTVLSKPLPYIDRSLGPLSVHEALLVLVGQGMFVVQQDPLNRTINFTLTRAGYRWNKAEQAAALQKKGG